MPMKRLLSLFTLALAGLGVPAIAADPPTATTAQGRVAGLWDEGLRVFTGIPYAQPPVGERRWRPPAPAVSWPGVRAALAFGPDCVQQTYLADRVYFEQARPRREARLTRTIMELGRASGRERGRQ